VTPFMYNTVLCCKYLSSGIMLGFFMLPVACWQSEWVSHVAVVAHREGSSGREPGMPGEGRHGGWTCERAEFRRGTRACRRNPSFAEFARFWRKGSSVLFKVSYFT